MMFLQEQESSSKETKTRLILAIFKMLFGFTLGAEHRGSMRT